MIHPMRRTHSLFRISLALLALLACASCAAKTPWVELKGQRFTVEIADSPDAQALGLMFRDQLPNDHGMLFIFAREAPRSFWMKNTRIPLDILYFDQNLALVSMSQDTPPCRVRLCPSYPSEGPAQYVLELNAGKAAELGVARGDRLVLHID
jgi:uncharacterized membrane protein (UPF0127 family)